MHEINKSHTIRREKREDEGKVIYHENFTELGSVHEQYGEIADRAETSDLAAWLREMDL